VPKTAAPTLPAVDADSTAPRHRRCAHRRIHWNRISWIFRF
jgi:hypothetical protein